MLLCTWSSDFQGDKKLETKSQFKRILVSIFTSLDYNLIHTLMSISVPRNRISWHKSGPFLWIHKCLGSVLVSQYHRHRNKNNKMSPACVLDYDDKPKENERELKRGCL